MFKKKINKGNVKLDFEEVCEGEEEESPKKIHENLPHKKIKLNLTEFSTTNIANDYKNAAQLLTDDLKYKSKPELIGKTKDNAFAYNEIDTDINQDARAIALKNIQISKDIKEGKLDKKYYKGLNGYADYVEKTDKAIRSSKFTGSLGPIRAPTHIRATCRFDYNPSLCKDWHDTGSCVFGDSCIYIHDRGDYKSGWELEKEWNEEQKKKALNNGHLSDIEDDDEEPLIDVPEKCPICESELSKPVVTLCDHFFCEKCALNHYGKSKTCFVCKKNINGNFNDGLKIIRKLREKREEQERINNILKNKKKNKKEITNEIEHNHVHLKENEEESLNEREKNKLLEGVEFESEIINVTDENEDLVLNHLSKEFKMKREKQRSQIKYESDWLL